LMSGWSGLAGSAGGATGAQKSVIATVPRLSPERVELISGAEWA
jgi:hypothetical protein